MVLLVTQDQPRVLKESDDRMWLAVNHMRPLMDLVGEDPQDHSEDDRPSICLPNAVIGSDPQSHSDEQGHGVA